MFTSQAVLFYEGLQQAVRGEDKALMSFKGTAGAPINM